MVIIGQCGGSMHAPSIGQDGAAGRARVHDMSAHARAGVLSIYRFVGQGKGAIP